MAEGYNAQMREAEISRLERDLSSCIETGRALRALNAELLAALEVALPVVEEAEDDMDTQGEWADEPIAPQIRAAITKARGG